jgi:hypothetical protein
MINGLKICRPAGSPSIVVTGSGSQTASVVGQGSIEFANAASLSLNGVFSSEYDNYMISVHVLKASGLGNADHFFRLRTSGTDAAAGNYTWQMLNASSTTVSGVRSSSQTQGFIGTNFLADSTLRNGYQLYLYGPFLTQPTASRSVVVSGNTGAAINDIASTHSLSISYDGISFFPESTRTMTGIVSVYGLVN